ncbi:hypothetical protein BsIDN1_19990 [Bacillus safensis]|uniref:Uncharacterized protein n=1 Tax=Bacillus safensis TaxID=561879 RepID=A0A5S9M625_BACIA|nr:hypothetical protein BsIDN1_19990 [Bacillus safensis]
MKPKLIGEIRLHKGMNMDRFITFTVPPFPIYIASGKGVFHQGERHISRTFTVFDLLYVTKR